MRFDLLRRREFITLLGGAAAMGPLAARAQQAGRTRRIGVLMVLAESDPEGQTYVAAFQEGLQKLGWMEGRDVRVDARWGGGDAERLRAYAKELVGLKPDIIVAGATAALVPLKQATQTIPIVFAQVSDPVGDGFVPSLSHPGGHITGFALYEYAIAVKWLELLKEIAPRVVRVIVIYDPANPSTSEYFRQIEASAPLFGVQVSATSVRNAAEIEHAIDAFAGEFNGGLIVLPSPVTVVHRELIVALAAKHRLPAVYAYRVYVTSGGLASYGVDVADVYRQAASYVDRILKGEKAGELPIQHASKFELTINLKTAIVLGLEVPVPLLARTDEVIE